MSSRARDSRATGPTVGIEAVIVCVYVALSAVILARLVYRSMILVDTNLVVCYLTKELKMPDLAGIVAYRRSLRWITRRR